MPARLCSAAVSLQSRRNVTLSVEHAQHPDLLDAFNVEDEIGKARDPARSQPLDAERFAVQRRSASGAVLDRSVHGIQSSANRRPTSMPASRA